MSGTFKHLDLSARIEIERMLSVCASATEIADKLGVCMQTVTREVKRGATDCGRAKVYGYHWNGCGHQRRCQLRGVCGLENCSKRCASCRAWNCTGICADFEMNACVLLERWPHTCNGCLEYKKCSFPRRTYQASVADARAKGLLVASRIGPDMTEDELAQIARVCKPLLDNKLSPAVIWAGHKNELPCSERTFYRLVHDGWLEGICTLDLPFAVRYRPRRQDGHPSRTNIAAEDLKGRTYADFLTLDASMQACAVEMDCVCGRAGDTSALLTLFWREWHFQLIIWLDNHDSEHVERALDRLERSLVDGLDDYFPDILLTDRGSEFAHARQIEEACYQNPDFGPRCRVYYCDPMRSDQKGSCECAHRLIRRIIPKGTSLDEEVCPEWIGLLTSHVNSMPRTSLGGRSPMSLAMENLPLQFFSDYGLTLIPTDELVLRPSLLGL